MTTPSFGCDVCWPDNAEQAWINHASLDITQRLVDESHYIVKLHQCPHCQQQFVSVFSERVDWLDGEDPQDRQVMPVTPAECEALQHLPDALALYQLAPKRQSLHWELPKGEYRRVRWRQGLHPVPHD